MSQDRLEAVIKEQEHLHLDTYGCENRLINYVFYELTLCTKDMIELILNHKLPNSKI